MSFKLQALLTLPRKSKNIDLIELPALPSQNLSASQANDTSESVFEESLNSPPSFLYTGI